MDNIHFCRYHIIKSNQNVKKIFWNRILIKNTKFLDKTTKVFNSDNSVCIWYTVCPPCLSLTKVSGRLRLMLSSSSMVQVMSSPISSQISAALPPARYEDGLKYLNHVHVVLRYSDLEDAAKIIQILNYRHFMLQISKFSNINKSKYELFTGSSGWHKQNPPTSRCIWFLVDPP